MSLIFFLETTDEPKIVWECESCAQLNDIDLITFFSAVDMKRRIKCVHCEEEFYVSFKLLGTRGLTLRAAVQSEQNSASELLVTFDNNNNGGMDVDDLKKRLRGKHGWLTVKYFESGQAQMFIAPNSNRSAGG